ncbi:hypothetical protein AB0J35_19980 [Nonomuraea angiospora]|uniref:hypothetical protein n=1 Tax=Nonomuraea angiospora TaxID=46172 RepID=UPI0034375D03
MSETERIHTDHAVARRLGNWTTAGRFEVRTRYGQTTVEHQDLRWSGRGQVKDHQAPAEGSARTLEKAS